MALIIMILKDGNRLRVGFTASAFDLLHPGHISMLEEAKLQCDYLIVGLHVDPTIDRPDTKNKPVQTILERGLQLRAVKHVDEIIVYETENDLLHLLTMLPIDVRIIGEEYRDKEYTGKDLGIETHYNKRRHTYSTSELRKRLNGTGSN